MKYIIIWQKPTIFLSTYIEERLLLKDDRKLNQYLGKWNVIIKNCFFYVWGENEVMIIIFEKVG